MATNTEYVKFSDFVSGLSDASESDLTSGNQFPINASGNPKKLGADYLGAPSCFFKVSLENAFKTESCFLTYSNGKIIDSGSSNYKTYFFRVESAKKILCTLAHNSASDVAVAFMSGSGVLRNDTCLSYKYAINGIKSYDVSVPDGCNYVVISNRIQLLNECTIFATNNILYFADDVLSSKKIVSDISFSNFFLPVWVRNTDNKIVNETSHRSYVFANNGYKSIEANVGSNGIDYWIVAFYSSVYPKNETFISGIKSVASSSPYTVYGNIPEGCKSIIVTTRKQNNDNPSVKFYSSAKSFNNIPNYEFDSYARRVYSTLNQQKWSWNERVDGQKNSTQTTFMWFSDIHGEAQAVSNMEKIYNAYFKGLVDCRIHTGDTAADHINDNSSNVVPVDVLNVIGNHDAYINNSHDLVSSSTEYYNKFFKDIISGWGVVQPSDAETEGKCYYYKDFSGSNIRLIVLDSCNYSGFENFLDDNGVQDSWLQSVLNDSKSNNKNVVVASHYPPSTISQNWQINGFCTKKNSFSAVTIGAVSRIESFVNAGGKFVCWICGHQHDDQFGTFGTLNLPVVQLASENVNRGECTKRERGTLDEHNFNFITFDTTKKLIKVVKFGCNQDEYMRNRYSMCYDYGNKVLVSAN